MPQSYWEVFVLAVVQGLTEFLPISSTAHLRIVPALCGWLDPGTAFSAVIQLGTLISLFAYFGRDLLRIAANWTSETLGGRLARSPEGKLGWMMIVATVPIVVCGLLFENWIDRELRSLYVIATALIVLALVLAAVEIWKRRQERAGLMGREFHAVTWGDCILVGLFQAVALVPGSSRSGTTITGGLWGGLSRATAARFSFLLSIPAVFAAAVYKLLKEGDQLFATSHDLGRLLFGLVVTAVVGYAAIAGLIRFLQRYSTWCFIAYRILLGIVLLALLATDTLQP